MGLRDRRDRKMFISNQNLSMSCDRGMYAKVDNDPRPTDQVRPAVDNKMSVVSCAKHALDESLSVRLSLARLCPQSIVLFDRVRTSSIPKVK